MDISTQAKFALLDDDYIFHWLADIEDMETLKTWFKTLDEKVQIRLLHTDIQTTYKVYMILQGD